MPGWISEQAFQDECIPTAALQNESVTAAKIELATITVNQMSDTLLKYLLEVGRVDYSAVDYCKVG